MPESKKDQQLRGRTEIVNFVECGDARGTAWLAKHPADLDRAALLVKSRLAVEPAPNALE